MVGKNAHVSGRSGDVDLHYIGGREDGLELRTPKVRIAGRPACGTRTHLVGEHQRELELVARSLRVATTAPGSCRARQTASS